MQHSLIEIIVILQLSFNPLHYITDHLILTINSIKRKIASKETGDNKTKNVHPLCIKFLSLINILNIFL